MKKGAQCQDCHERGGDDPVGRRGDVNIETVAAAADALGRNGSRKLLSR